MVYSKVQCTKQNRIHCRRLASELQAMGPILTDIQNRFTAFSAMQQETIGKSLEMMLRDFEEVQGWIEQQMKTGAVVRFMKSGGIKTNFENLSGSIKNAREILMLAIINKIDTASDVMIKHSANHKESSSSEVEVARTAMIKAHEAKDFEGVIKAGKEALQALHRQMKPSPNASMNDGASIIDHDMQSIHFNIACACSRLNKVVEAITHLETANEFGWRDYKQMDSEEDLAPLRGFKEFVELRKQMETEVLRLERWRKLPDKEIDEYTRLFDRYDTDGSGEMSVREFRLLIKRGWKGPSEGDLDFEKLFANIDEDKSGDVSLNEYLNFMADNRDKLDNAVIHQSAPPLSPQVSFVGAAMATTAFGRGTSQSNLQRPPGFPPQQGPQGFPMPSSPSFPSPPGQQPQQQGPPPQGYPPQPHLPGQQGSHAPPAQGYPMPQSPNFPPPPVQQGPPPPQGYPPQQPQVPSFPPQGYPPQQQPQGYPLQQPPMYGQGYPPPQGYPPGPAPPTYEPYGGQQQQQAFYDPYANAQAYLQQSNYYYQ